MKWQAAFAGAMALAFMAFLSSSIMVPSTALADVRIVGDPGGEVSSFVHKYEQIRESGEQVVIDGPCLSACTLLTGIVPPSHICVTPRAVLGFHAASYYDDASRSLVPTREGSAVVMRLYPAAIRGWIARHGGLTPHMIELRGHDLAALYQPCR